MTCPRCLWPVARLGLCDTCEAEDQARLHGQVEAPIPGAVPAPVRQMGSRQGEMAQFVRWTVYAEDPTTGQRRPQVVTYRPGEALDLVLAMRREMPGVRCGAFGRVVAVEELAAVGGREVWE